MLSRVIFTSDFLIAGMKCDNLPEKPDSSTSVFSSDHEWCIKMLSATQNSQTKKITIRLAVLVYVLQRFFCKTGTPQNKGTKGAEWLRQVRGLVYHPTFLWLLEEWFIQEKQILNEMMQGEKIKKWASNSSLV